MTQEPKIALEEKDPSLLDKLSTLFAPTHKPQPVSASPSDWVQLDGANASAPPPPAPHKIVSIPGTGSRTAPTIHATPKSTPLLPSAGPAPARPTTRATRSKSTEEKRDA